MNKPVTRHDALEVAIDAITESYGDSLEINNLESAALPNRRAVIEALNHLKPIIYLGFYATRPLTRENLRYAVCEHAYPAYEILVEQIHRVVRYEEEHGEKVVRGPHWPEEVVVRLFSNLPELRRLLNEDALAAYDGDPAAQGVEEIVFSYPAIQAITTHRIAHTLYAEGVPMIPRIMSEHAHGKTGIDIHPGAQIGRKFFIDHGTGVVVGETCVIGDNVKLYQGVTLGALSHPRDARGALIRQGKRHPTIEDKVTIYSGTTILGGNTVIGEGSVIGGNVWLVDSVPPNSKITYSGQLASAQRRSSRVSRAAG